MFFLIAIHEFVKFTKKWIFLPLICRNLDHFEYANPWFQVGLVSLFLYSLFNKRGYSLEISHCFGKTLFIFKMRKLVFKDEKVISLNNIKRKVVIFKMVNNDVHHFTMRVTGLTTL